MMSPLLSAIGRRGAGLRPIGSVRKSGAAPRKALLPPGEERREGTCGSGVTSSVDGTRARGTPRGRAHASAPL